MPSTTNDNSAVVMVRRHQAWNDLSNVLNMLFRVESSRFARVCAVLPSALAPHQARLDEIVNASRVAFSIPTLRVMNRHARKFNKPLELVVQNTRINSELRNLSRSLKPVESRLRGPVLTALRTLQEWDNVFDLINSAPYVSVAGCHHCQRCCPSNQSDNSRAESPPRRRKGHLGFDLRS